jgi:hypothetical protein
MIFHSKARTRRLTSLFPSQLNEMNAEASAAVEGAVSAMEYALKKKGISASMFPSTSEVSA